MAVLVDREPELLAAVARAERHPEVALDVESNGLFAYRPRICVVQIATPEEVVVVDTMATPPAALGTLLASTTTAKIVHDVAFDARLFAEAGLALANVKDTSLAARMLGRTATGLGSLLAAELDVKVDKAMQHHDWAARPLGRRELEYLESDVRFLAPLATKLFDEAAALGIAEAIEEETRFRLAQAAASVGTPDTRPPYLRLKGIERAPKEDLALLRRLASIREDEARHLDVPPYKVLGPDLLFRLARTRPATREDLTKIPGAASGRARALGAAILRAIADPDTTIPEEDAAWLAPPRVPPGVAKARRAREQRLTVWRKREAALRGVDEQVVLPGHCLKALADLESPTLPAIAGVGGIGAFRVERDGAGLLAALAEAT